MFGKVPSDGDAMPPFIFLSYLRLNTAAKIKSLEEVVIFGWWLLENLSSVNKTLRLATQAGEPNLGCLKVFATTLLLTI